MSRVTELSLEGVCNREEMMKGNIGTLVEVSGGTLVVPMVLGQCTHETIFNSIEKLST